MTKSGYLANAAKYFALGTALLLIASLLQNIQYFAPDFALRFKALSSTAPTFAVVFLFPLFSYLALSGEAVGYRKAGQKVQKLRANNMKKALLVLFVAVFFRSAVTALSKTAQSGTFFGTVTALFCTVFLTTVSYAPFLMLISIHCYRRDSSVIKLKPLYIAVIIISVLYYAVKLFNEAISVFPAVSIPDTFALTVGNDLFCSILCMLQYAADVVLFLVVRNRYAILSGREEELKDHIATVGPKVIDLFRDEGYGIDFQDDLRYDKQCISDDTDESDKHDGLDESDGSVSE